LPRGKKNRSRKIRKTIKQERYIKNNIQKKNKI
jgi:hypothetical protein